ncbi:MAG: hypothetical protein ACLPSH_19470 [Vulcanimicrobiaceae bacterium]
MQHAENMKLVSFSVDAEGDTFESTNEVAFLQPGYDGRIIINALAPDGRYSSETDYPGTHDPAKVRKTRYRVSVMRRGDIASVSLDDYLGMVSYEGQPAHVFVREIE